MFALLDKLITRFDILLCGDFEILATLSLRQGPYCKSWQRSKA